MFITFYLHVHISLILVYLSLIKSVLIDKAQYISILLISISLSFFLCQNLYKRLKSRKISLALVESYNKINRVLLFLVKYDSSIYVTLKYSNIRYPLGLVIYLNYMKIFWPMTVWSALITKRLSINATRRLYIERWATWFQYGKIIVKKFVKVKHFKNQNMNWMPILK